MMQHSPGQASSGLSAVPLLTEVVLQLLGLPVLRGGDEVPHEALDLVVAAVVDQAVGQQGPADGLHVAIRQLLLEASVVQDVLPPAPPGRTKEEKRRKTRWRRRGGGGDKTKHG